jgi:hypothetical protein
MQISFTALLLTLFRDIRTYGINDNYPLLVLIKCPDDDLRRPPSAPSLILDLENTVNMSQHSDADDVNVIPVTAVPDRYYEEVYSFYSRHNRARLAEIEDILERYEGREVINSETVSKIPHRHTISNNSHDFGMNRRD